MKYPEYGWIQHSLDETREEERKVRELAKKMKEAHYFRSNYMILPLRMRKNPLFPHFVELRSVDGPKLEAILKCVISEN